jgi:hypothetical protein
LRYHRVDPETTHIKNIIEFGDFAPIPPIPFERLDNLPWLSEAMTVLVPR